MSEPNQEANQLATQAPKEAVPREQLIKAKESGLDDASAIEYAGITSEQFDHMLATDPLLERDLLRARATAFLKHVQWSEGASQWQPHEFLLTRFFSDKIPNPDSLSRKSPDDAKAIAVMDLLRHEELPDAFEILTQGIRLYRQLPGKTGSSLPCPKTEIISRTA